MAGKICHIDFSVKDIAVAKEFYGSMFGWTFTDVSGDYVLFSAADGVGGGFQQVEETPPDGAVQLIIEVDDIESMLAKIAEVGGSTEKEKSELPMGFGSYAMFRDSLGSLAGLWSKA
jgi:predicted enzyme related to lactoylglutathione lyase